MWEYVLLGFIVYYLAREPSTQKEASSIIIIGSGAAGIAAGTRLLQHGYNNITILEAGNRIGGRIYTTQLGGYPVDVGGQWVHGEENNQVFEMAWPLGLLERSTKTVAKVFSSSGEKMPEPGGHNLLEYFNEVMDMDIPEEYKKKSVGDWFQFMMNEYFEAHPDIKQEQRDLLLRMMNLMDMTMQDADTWSDVTLASRYISKGDQLINWKERAYSTIIDILLQRFSNPDEELPFVNKTVLNAEVTEISYDNPNGVINVRTANGIKYSADHVIVTPSLGVMKENYKTLFNPPLSDAKVNAIKNIHFGSVSKIYLFYLEPWWTNTNSSFTADLFWTDRDRKQLLKDVKKAWILGIFKITEIEHKPGLLCVWMTGPYAREMETVPEADVLTEVKATLQQFLGHEYNLTEPTEMLRSTWYSNKYFRGTYGYKSPETLRSGAMRYHLAEPIRKNGKPQILFAGEATSIHQYSTVHGAIGTGWREADRLIKYYTDHNSATTP